MKTPEARSPAQERLCPFPSLKDSKFKAAAAPAQVVGGRGQPRVGKGVFPTWSWAGRTRATLRLGTWGPPQSPDVTAAP